MAAGAGGLTRGGGQAAVLGQQATGGVVVVAQAVAERVDALHGLAQGIEAPVGVVAQCVAVGDQAALRVVGKALGGAVGVLHRQEAPGSIDLVAHGVAQRVGDGHQLAQRVILVAGGLARAVGVGQQLAGGVPRQALGGAVRIADACGAVGHARVVVEVVGGKAGFVGFFTQAAQAVVPPAAGVAQGGGEAGDFAAGVKRHTGAGAIGGLDADGAPQRVQLVAGGAAQLVGDGDQLAEGAVGVAFSAAVGVGDARPALAALARGALKVVAGAPAQRFGDVGGLGLVVNIVI